MVAVVGGVGRYTDDGFAVRAKLELIAAMTTTLLQFADVLYEMVPVELAVRTTEIVVGEPSVVVEGIKIT
jgi:hypothetical protein